MGKLSVPKYVYQIRQKLSGRENVEEAVDIILSENGIKKYPIDVLDIASKIGFVVKSADFNEDRVSGILWDGNEDIRVNGEDYKRIIIVNKRETPQRQLFTVAHEIGHFMMHCNDESNFYERYMSDKTDNVNNEQKIMEDDADYFAANLLLPERILKRYIEVNVFASKQELEESVMRAFFVEKATIDRRLKEIEYEC